MIPYSIPARREISAGGGIISSFVSDADSNIDAATVQSFGEEWLKFSEFSEEEISAAGREYFDLLTPEMHGADKTALDVGCGGGRWSKYASKFFGFVEAIDPSDAVLAAQAQAGVLPNVRVSQAGVDSIPFEDAAFDFVFSLGVLHHIPDTPKAMQQCVAKLKAGGHFLVYLYYALDNRGGLFRAVFRIADKIRRVVSHLPPKAKRGVCDAIAFGVYLPLVGTARLADGLGAKKLAARIPLSHYRHHSLRIIRNDALDRFGTPLEQRFSKQDIIAMMQASGLQNIVVSDSEPFWHAVGKKV